TGLVTTVLDPIPGSIPFLMGLGSDGGLWFTDGNNQIGHISLPDDTITEFPIPTPNSEAGFITTGPDGNIWFRELAANQIGEVVFHPRVHWINPAGGDWDTASNWRDEEGVNRVPGPDDQAIIDIPGQNGFTVTHSSGAADSVHRLTSQDAIVLS